jgi:hypothetical protein
MLVEFASIVGTVRCAVDIQRCMANRCTMHRARPLDDKTHCRELRRSTSLDLPLPASA